MKLAQKLFLILSIFTIISCSSDDDSSNTSSSADVFNYIYDGTSQTISSFEAKKSESTIAVIGKMDNGQRIEIVFNSFGNLGYVNSYSATDFNFLDAKSHFNFSSNYFNFSLLSLDETNKKVKVEFSGKLYDDEDNLNSTFVNVSGDFDVTYQDVAPSIAGLDVSAKIAGNDWYSTRTNESTFSTQNFYSDDEYAISFRLSSTITPGNYTFNNLSTSDYVFLSKFKDTSFGDYYEGFTGVGSVNLISKTAYSIGYIYEGTYSLTATNPNDSSTIQVTNGKFKYFDF